ncbi:glycoside hydrolase family 108 protein [Alteromonas oceani]|uniref:Glycoside hydrolase family 108 protein n=1 Tax=Alteromonas oceani TaxID=2071609 RepID=A0ABV7JQC2_9ALTE|nr:glycosyl hydrolase 108 family protein [Alteromonas oceani]
MNINDMIYRILAKEGGYVNHTADFGGPSNFGITQNTLSRYLGTVVTPDILKALDIETVRDIYELNYYRIPRINKLPEPIQPFLFDTAVNHGPRRAIKFLQQVCNEAGFGPILCDGFMGPKTQAQAQACFEELGDWMLAGLVRERQMFYVNVISFDSGSNVFLKGLLARARSFLPEHCEP